MIEITTSEFKKWKGDTLAVFATQNDSPHLFGLGKNGVAIAALAKSDGFKAADGQSLLLRAPSPSPAERLLLIGMGPQKDWTLESLRRAAPKALRLAESLGLSTIAIVAPTIAETSAGLKEEFQALAEGLFLGSYRYDRHRTPSPDSMPVTKVILLLDGHEAEATQAIAKAKLYSEATAIARDLINEPPSRMNPEHLSTEAKKVQKASVSVKVYEKKDLEKMGMGGLLGVGSGSSVPPRLVEMIYKPAGKSRKVVALVGKGITFDSGGLSLKPAQSMETMKDDMSGSAAVLGIMSVVAALKIPVEVRGYMAIAENMPGGRAQKPGDVLKAYNGKTIEVLNTDAEGRLVLADALAYASSKKPDVLIDIATLTGAAVVALGHLVTGVMSNDPALVKALIAAGTLSGEKFWELPLVKEYQPDIKSKIADLKNIGGRRGEAGTIIGGLFLQEFANHSSWAHLDIAGPSWSDSDQPYCPTGGTGHPVRTILRYLESL